MAIFDAGFEFLDDEDMFTSTGIKYEGSTAKTLDWQAADLEMGAGESVWMNVKVGTTAFDGAGNIQAVITADDTAGGHDASSTEVMRGPVIAIGASTTSAPGAWLMHMPMPVNVDILRYLGVGISCSGAATAGTIDAYLDHGPQSSFDTQVSTSNIT